MTGRRAFRLTCALQVLVVALGFGIAVARQPDSGPGRTAVTTATRPDGGGSSQASARQEARWLLSLARVPDGAHPTGRRPHNLSGPVMGTPGVKTLVIRTAYWRVAMTYSATVSWVHAHPPRDLIQSGSAESGGPDGSTAGYGYSDRPTASWSSADLEIGVAPDGDGSAIRADAVVVWLDPKPLRDVAAGRRVRVTLAGGCPTSDRGLVGVRNEEERLSKALLPAGRPSGGLLCRYGGLNDEPFVLHHAARLDADQATAVAEAFRALPLSHVDGGATSCPMDDGAVAIAALAFPGSGDTDIWVTLTGCSLVANGYIVTAAGSVPDMIRHYG